MKQLLFLLLFPCLALAQYQGNANQKITLGEQTTADGLVYRGIAADTTLTVKSDTAAYFVLDTVNLNLYTYKASASGRKWRQLGADTAAIAYVNTYGTQTVNGAKTFTSAVTATRFNPTANTVTGNGMYLPTTNTLGFSTNGTNKLTLDASGNLGLSVTPSNAYSGSVTAEIGANTVIWTETPTGLYNSMNIGLNFSYNSAGTVIYKNNTLASSRYTQYTGQHQWYTAPSGTAGNAITFTQAMTLDASGNLGIGTATPAVQLHTTGGVRFATFAGGGTTTLDVDNTGNLARTSSIELKKDVTPINYGLNQILQINPINFNWIDEDKYGNENENGFIAEDVMNVIPNVVGSDAHGLFMDYTKLIPILTKAIQEQNLLIKALEQRIINLENK